MITAIVDLQFGSTGKGLIAGYLSGKNHYDVVVSANMPNAGHTFVDDAGQAWVNKVLPSGVYSPGLEYICIGPGAVFSIDQLKKEVDQLRQRNISAKVIVHPYAGILLPEHAEEEKRLLNAISSTMQGSMAAMIQKMHRNVSRRPNVANYYIDQIEDAGAQVSRDRDWIDMMRSAKDMLVEGSQGYSLGINAGFYPYCTSRDCTVWRLLADAGVVVDSGNGRKMVNVIGTARLHPIRVGNTEGGFSGPRYPDQRETSWEELGQTPERTTVTNRVRRVFTFSAQQITEAMLMNSVDSVFLNFCNYDIPLAIATADQIDEIWRQMHNGEVYFDAEHEQCVRWMGFGPAAKDVLERGRYVG